MLLQREGYQAVEVDEGTVARLHEWAAALRSGEYAQMMSRLHGDEGYCCLGVLCDLDGRGHWAKGYWSDSHGQVYDFVPGDALPGAMGSDARLPLAIAGHYGLASPLFDESSVGEPAIEGYVFEASGTGPEFNSLASMNDGGYSFAVIADAIDHYADALAALLATEAELATMGAEG